MSTKQPERTRSGKFSTVFNELIEGFGLLFAGDRIVIPEEIQKEDGSTTLRSSQFHINVSRKQHILVVWDRTTHRDRMQCMHCTHDFRKNFKNQLPPTEKNKLPVLIEPGKLIDFFQQTA